MNALGAHDLAVAIGLMHYDIENMENVLRLPGSDEEGKAKLRAHIADARARVERFRAVLGETAMREASAAARSQADA